MIKILYSKAEPFNGITSYTKHLYEGLKESDLNVELKMDYKCDKCDRNLKDHDKKKV